MADLLDLEELEQSTDSDEKKNYVLLIVIIAILVVGTGVVIGAAYYYSNRCFTNYEVESEVERNDSDNVVYSYFNGNILKCSRSGVSAIDNTGKSLWNGGFEMKQPQVDTCGEYVVVADVTGKNFYVYNGKDEGKSIETALPIVRAKVAKHGIVAVLLEDSDSNVLNIYNPYSSADSLLVEIPTNVSDEGYPIDFDISPDGNSIVVSFLVLGDSGPETKVSFYNFTEVGQDQSTLVGGMSFGDEAAANIEFIGEDEVVVFREKGFSIFSKMKQPKQQAEQTFDEEIRSVGYNENYIAVVTGKSEDEKNTLHLFDVKGREKLTKEISYDYSDLKIYNEEIFFVSNLECHILRANGHEKFSCKFDDGIDTMYPTTNGSIYTILETSMIQRVKLKYK